MLHKLAWFQLITEKRRLAAAVAGIAFAVMLQLAQLGFRDALFDSAVLLHRHLVADLIITSSLYEDELNTGSVSHRRLDQALAVPGVESVTPVDFGAAPFKNIQTGQDKTIVVIGFEPNRVVLDIPSVNEQARLLKLPDVALFDADARPEFGPVADTFRRDKIVTTEVSGRSTRINGLFELGASFCCNGHLIVSDTTFRKIFSRSDSVFEFGLIRLRPGSDTATVQADLIRRFPHDVRVLTPAQFAAIEVAFWDAATPIGFIFFLGTIVALLVGAVIVYQILYTDVTDHLPEYATMKAMGYRNRHLYVVVLEEAAILSVLGFPFGLGLAEVLYIGARANAHLPTAMTLLRTTIVFVNTLAMCGLSAIVAIRKLRAADPAEIF
jgi:DevC protein